MIIILLVNFYATVCLGMLAFSRTLRKIYIEKNYRTGYISSLECVKNDNVNQLVSPEEKMNLAVSIESMVAFEY